jgi:NAD(P)-dependent dehydrogenase (short-subunit alcohol dehydrogenase family)
MKRTYIITGGNSGLGYQCTKYIALENLDNHIVIASRNMEKSRQAATEIAAKTGNPHIYAMLLNLASPASVRNFSKTIENSDLPPLYGLVCNAIASSSSIEYTDDGFEMTFETGHLGHFLLANLLSRNMQDNGRIVFVSSDQHNPPKLIGKVCYTDALDLACPKKSNHTMRYSGTKLCNLYCTYEMAAQIKNETTKSVTINAFNPGFMADTGLGGSAKSAGERIIKRIAPVFAHLLGTYSSAKKSGELLADMMTGKQYENITGKYFDRGKEVLSSELLYNKANAVNLWERSVELTQLQQSETFFKFRTPDVAQIRLSRF